ncbi:Bacterial type II secretion system protein F domain protein [Corynebacterium capitovis DSM 44611]|uniref:type II secretion system F family protein n=1 Tax=Corynebacterium capitovis TaxID=131081 RepID=UPI0003629967|nr:type II secretion system F family protein [Corynebacterium capitovis]WKD56727.1 Bacterial type II secretion system protein F domain protein [Corynebacterium capitovis DSM 44611]
MMVAFSFVLFAAAFAVSPAPAFERISTTKTPRDGPARCHADQIRMAGDIELFAACFRAGMPAASAAAAVAESHSTPRPTTEAWRTVAALAALGAEPDRAWEEMRHLPGGPDLANLVVLSGSSGTAIAAGCERIANRLRCAAGDEATAKAERAGVLIAIPLTAFFLPAFFVLGLAPVVLGLAGSLTTH